MSKKTTTLIRIEPELLDFLRKKAEENTRSLNGQIIHILNQYAEKEKNNSK